MKPKTLVFRRHLKTLSLSISFTGALTTAPMAFATSATWDGGSGGTGTNLNTAANWSGDVLPTASGDTATWNGTVAGNLVLNWSGFFGASPEATSYVLTSGQTGNLTLDATGNFDLAVNSITIASGAGAFTLGDGAGAVGSSGRIVFRGTTSGVSAQNTAYTSNLFTNDSSNTATWGADLNFGATGGAPRNLVFGGSGNWTVNSNLTGIGIQVTKSGAGTLSLTNAANAAIDIVLIDSGTLKVDGAGTLRSGTFAGTFINNGTFHYNSSAAQSISSAISGTGALIKGGNSVLTLTGNNSYSGNTTVDAGTLRIGSGGQLGAGTYAGNISLASGAVFEHASSASTTVGGATNRITGLGSITKSGSGTLRINSSQSFSGGVNLSGGILEYDGTGALGTGAISVSAGEITGRGAGGTLANHVVLNGNVQLGRSGIGSSMGFTGNFDLGGGVRTITMNGAAITMSGIISNGGLAKSGTSTLQLSNTGNTYSAGTVLNAGILEYTGAGTLGTGTVTINGGELTARGAGGTLANNFVVNGDFQLGRNGVGSGIGISGNVDLGGGTRTITTPGVDPTISGVISNGGLIKAGSSSLTLSGTNTYSGTTTVNAGKLVVSGSIATSAVTVTGANTTLASGSTGTIGSSVTVSNGAILAAGNTNSIGTATVGSGGTTLNTSSIFSWDLNVATPGSPASATDYDKVVASSLSGDGTAVFDVVLAGGQSFSDAFWTTDHNWDNVFSTTGLGADALGMSSVFASFTYSGAAIAPVTGSFSFTGTGGNTLTWTAVPEPSAALAGLLVAAGCLRRQRR